MASSPPDLTVHRLSVPGRPPHPREAQVVGVGLAAPPPAGVRLPERLGAVAVDVAQLLGFGPVAAHRAVAAADLVGHAPLVAPYRLALVIGAPGEEQQPRLRPGGQPVVSGDPVEPRPSLGPGSPPGPIGRAGHAAAPGCPCGPWLEYTASTAWRYRSTSSVRLRTANRRRRAHGSSPPRTPNRCRAARPCSSRRAAHRHGSATGQAWQTRCARRWSAMAP